MSGITIYSVSGKLTGLGSVTDTPVPTTQQNALDLKANIASPTFTGSPRVPNVSAGDNTTRAANTTFVTEAVAQGKADLVASSPELLNTLNELASAIGDDPSFSATMAATLGYRLRFDTSTQGLTTQQKANAVTNLGLATVAVSGAKADIGLGNVDNTSDANKPVSTAQATADTAVQTAAASDATTKANAAQAAAIAAVTPTSLGLGNVTNTSDANKPVSTAQQTALNLKEDSSAKDANGGYVGLTGMAVNFWNAAKTFMSSFTNANTAARTYTFPDKNITVAGIIDIPDIHTATAKTTPVDADEFGGSDSAASFVFKKFTFANIYATIKGRLDAIYHTVGGALGTPSSGNLSACTVDGTNPPAPNKIPLVSKSANYTYTLADGKVGQGILHPASDTSARTMTIDSNANTPHDVGTCLFGVNQHGAGVITLAITTDTMRQVGTGATGSRTVAADGNWNALKITTTEWLVWGNGVT